MPLRQDIKKVLVIGSGPIVIGQAFLRATKLLLSDSLPSGETKVSTFSAVIYFVFKFPGNKESKAAIT